MGLLTSGKGDAPLEVLLQTFCPSNLDNNKCVVAMESIPPLDECITLMRLGLLANSCLSCLPSAADSASCLHCLLCCPTTYVHRGRGITLYTLLYNVVVTVRQLQRLTIKPCIQYPQVHEDLLTVRRACCT